MFDVSKEIFTDISEYQILKLPNICNLSVSKMPNLPHSTNIFFSLPSFDFSSFLPFP